MKFTKTYSFLYICIINACSDTDLAIVFASTESCKVDFKDPNVLYEFTLTVTPGQK